MSTLSTPLLCAAQEAVEDRVPLNMQHDFLCATVAATKIALHGNRISIWGLLDHSEDPVHDCAASAINVCLMLLDLADLEFSPALIKLAAEGMMIQALDFVHRANKVSVGKSELARAQQIFSDLINEHMGTEPHTLDMSAALSGDHHGRIN